MTDVSCLECTHAKMSPGFNVPICGLHAIPVSISNGPAGKSVAVRIARDCADHALRDNWEPMGVLTDTEDKNIVLIGVAAAVSMDAFSKASMHDRATHCGSCKYYATPESVKDELGFESGICMANGTLVNPNRLATVAASCQVGVEGRPFRGKILDSLSVTGKLAFLNVTDDTPQGEKSGPQAPDHHSRIDPREWPSDRPVTEFESAAGVKAWRRVSDPKGYGVDHFIPIIDWQMLTDEHGTRLVPDDPRDTYGASKPHLYRDHNGLLYNVTAQIFGGVSPTTALDMNVALIGEAGTGKTEFFTWLAWLMDVPFTRISITQTTEKYELEGMGGLANEGGATVTRYQDSLFADAYQKPGVIVIDELNAGPPEVQQFLRPIIDSSSQFVIQSQKVKLNRDPFCFIGFTMNPDDNPIYRGIQPLSEADWDRLNPELVELPSEEVQRDIIRLHVEEDGLTISDRQLDNLMKISAAMRSRYRNRELPMPWGMRSVIKAAKLLNKFNYEDAICRACAFRLEPATRDILIQEVRALVG